MSTSRIAFASCAARMLAFILFTGSVLTAYSVAVAIAPFGACGAPANRPALVAQARQTSATASQLPEKFADIHGARICYLDSGGAGESVVFMHAGTGSSRVWEQPEIFNRSVLQFIRRRAGK